jgi:RNA polymerase sigma-70 factor (ECF subfamily)
MSALPPDPLSTADRKSRQEDTALLERLRRNDREALAALYDMYGRLAYSLACRIVGNPADAEDVVQESFLALWRQSSQLDPARGSVRAFLATIVRRRAIDALRRRSGTPARPLEEVTALPADTTDPAEVASMTDERESIQRALKELPKEQREAIDLTYFGGLTIAEMAGLQNVPLGTAKSRLRLALDRLRNALAVEPA